MWKTRAVIVPWALVALLVVLALLYLRFAPPTPPTYVSVPGATQYVPVPQKVVKVQKVTVPGPERVVLVPSATVSEKLKWPEIAQDNVLAVGEVAPHKGKTSVVAKAEFTDNTMTTRLVMRQEPPPFLELKKEVRLGAYYGNGATFIPSVTLRPLRVGPVEVVVGGMGIYGSGVNETRAFVGAEVQFGF